MFSDIKVSPERCTLSILDGVIFILVNTLVSLIGSLGNVFVCLTVLYTPNLRVISNYCIVNLALADLMVTMFAQPLAISVFVGKLGGTCYVRAEHAARFIGNLSCAVSMLTLATMSVDRCFVILKPMRYKTVVTPRILKSILAPYWFLAGIVPMLDAFVEDKHIYIYFILSGMTVLYTVVIACYSAIFVVVRKQSAVRQRELQNHQTVNREKDKQLAKTIAFVIGFFTIFWVPFGYHIARKPNKNFGVDYIASVTASFANSAINPIIYFYRNKVFRGALKRILTIPYFHRNRVSPFHIQRKEIIRVHLSKETDVGI